MYPTAIIVLVCLNMSFHDDVTRAEKMVSTIRFGERGPADGPSIAGGTTRQGVLDVKGGSRRARQRETSTDGDMEGVDLNERSPDERFVMLDALRRRCKRAGMSEGQTSIL